MMRHFIVIAALIAVAGFTTAATASAKGVSPAQLADAGWTCFLPPEFNPNVHCAPPGQLEGILSGEARSAMFLAFATDQVRSENAPLLGTERLIRADLYRGQPCPTDPSPADPPTYTYSSLYPRFGWNYYICHTFDSPW
jgi:hypothetical protein